MRPLSKPCLFSALFILLLNMLLVPGILLVSLLSCRASAALIDECDYSDDECSRKPLLSCDALSVAACIESFTQAQSDFIDYNELSSVLFDHADSPASILEVILSQSDLDIAQFVDVMLEDIVQENIKKFNKMDRAKLWILSIIDLIKDDYSFDASLAYYLLAAIFEIDGNTASALDYYHRSIAIPTSQYKIQAKVGICRVKAFYATNSEIDRKILMLDAKQACIDMLPDIGRNRQVSSLVSFVTLSYNSKYPPVLEFSYLNPTNSICHNFRYILSVGNCFTEDMQTCTFAQYGYNKQPDLKSDI